MILTGRTEDLIQEEGWVLNQLEEWRTQEELLWKQKYRIHWLYEGERNTSFFHKAMIQRQQHNRIFSLKTVEGNRLVEHEDMENELVTHFSEILLEPNKHRLDYIARVFALIPKLVTRDQNLALLREITLAEVEDIVKEMPRNKAPGPDGFTIEFIKHPGTSWVKRLSI